MENIDNYSKTKKEGNLYKKTLSFFRNDSNPKNDSLSTKKIINYLNDSNKLPNIDKEIPVEFRGFSPEEIKKREDNSEKGYSVYRPDEEKIIVDETDVKGLTDYNFSNSNVKPISKQDAANFLFLHELGHAVHHQWSLANEKKLTEVLNKNDEKFINEMIKFEGFLNIPSEQLHGLHSSILEGYADLYACSMIREIYTQNGQKERGEELIKSIVQVRQDNYEKQNFEKKSYKYDVVDNLKEHNNSTNSKIVYQDFDSLNKTIMERNTRIGIKKFDDRLKEYTNPKNDNNEYIKEEFFFLVGFVENRKNESRSQAIETLENRINAKIQINKFMSTDNHMKAYSRGASFGDVNLKSGIIYNNTLKRPSLPSSIVSENNSQGISQKPKFSSNKYIEDDYSEKEKAKKPKLPSSVSRFEENNGSLGKKPSFKKEIIETSDEDKKVTLKDVAKLSEKTICSHDLKNKINSHENDLSPNTGKYKI